MGYLKITTKQKDYNKKLQNKTQNKKKNIKDREDPLSKRDKKENRTRHCRKKEKKRESLEQMNNNSNTGRGKDRTMSRKQRFWYIGNKKNITKRNKKNNVGETLTKDVM